MIKRAILQGSVLLVTILALWLVLSQPDYMKWFGLKEAGQNTEEKVGKMLWNSIRNNEEIIYNDSVNAVVDSILTKITDANDIDRKSIKLYIIENGEANAFAMPANYMIVYTGLIEKCERPEELAGVIGHELAHMQRRHVMRKLVREMGLAALLSATTGGRGGEAAQGALRVLTSSAYDRELETEADSQSVDYMIEAGINPSPFADLMYRMATETDAPGAAYWISSHPESEERAKAIIRQIGGRKMKTSPVVSHEDWQFLKNYCGSR